MDALSAAASLTLPEMYADGIDELCKFLLLFGIALLGVGVPLTYHVDDSSINVGA